MRDEGRSFLMKVDLFLLYIMWSKKPLKCDVDLPPGERSLYYQVLANEYHELKNAVKAAWIRTHHSDFSEDVFHDTIINCANACCTMTDRDSIYKYFYKSYENNMLRETQYSYNKKRSEVELNSILGLFYMTRNKSFCKDLYERIRKDKGERIARIIMDYAHGLNFNELVAKYNIKNIHKKARLLREYLKGIFPHYSST